MKKSLTTLIFFISISVNAHEISCPEGETLSHFYVDDQTGNTEECTSGNDCATKHASTVFINKTTISGNNEVTYEYGPPNVTSFDNSLGYLIEETRTHCYVSSGSCNSSSTTEKIGGATMNHTCSIPPPPPPEDKCQADDPSDLQIMKNGNLTPEQGGNVNNGYTCFRDSSGDLCGFQVPESQLHTRNGRNGGDGVLHAILTTRGGRNGTQHMAGNATFGECTQAFQDANPFVDDYPAIGNANPAVQPLDKVGNVITATMEDGTKVDVVLPVSQYNSDGTCSGSTESSCLAIIEVNDTGQDYAVITEQEEPPLNYVYEQTLTISSSNSNSDLPDLSTITKDGTLTKLDLYLPTQQTDPPLKGESDGSNTPSLSDSASLSFTGGTSGTGTSGGDGTGGGDGTDDGTGGGGTGTEKQQVELECGVGATGINCETTQKKILDEISWGDYNKTFPDLTEELALKKEEYIEAFNLFQTNISSVFSVSNIQFSGSLPNLNFTLDGQTINISTAELTYWLSWLGLMVLFMAYWEALVIVIS